MKPLNTILYIGVSIALAGAVLAPLAGFAQAIAPSGTTDSINIPHQAVEPIGELFNEPPALFDVSSGPTSTRVDTASAGFVTKVAPGELLPISLKLSNFGGGQRVDVVLNYGIFASDGHEIYSTSETVAVETTASFVKSLQIPSDVEPGIYTAKTSIIYQGQVVPATTQFPFTVERKILGFFQSDFLLYGGTLLLILILSIGMGYAFITRRGARFVPLDYSTIPRDKRPFFEILSDTIMQMRLRAGDEALAIASHIDGLKIDMETGRVIALTGPPAKIIAELVTEYEKLLGKKVSFSFRKGKQNL